MTNRQSAIDNHQSKILLALDPSSTVIGYAVMAVSGRLIEAGRITPDQAAASESFDRIAAMADDLWEILYKRRPDIILLEWTLGKVGRRRHRGGGAGLAVYGCGVGWCGCVCYRWAKDFNVTLIPVVENAWTRGVPKAERRAALLSLYPGYSPDRDPGGDAADALGLAEWWLREQKVVNRQ